MTSLSELQRIIRDLERDRDSLQMQVNDMRANWQREIASHNITRERMTDGENIIKAAKWMHKDDRSIALNDQIEKYDAKIAKQAIDAKSINSHPTPTTVRVEDLEARIAKLEQLVALVPIIPIKKEKTNG